MTFTFQSLHSSVSDKGSHMMKLQRLQTSFLENAVPQNYPREESPLTKFDIDEVRPCSKNLRQVQGAALDQDLATKRYTYLLDFSKSIETSCCFSLVKQ